MGRRLPSKTRLMAGLIASSVLAEPALAADDDRDLDRIPVTPSDDQASPDQAPPPGGSGLPGVLYIEESPEVISRRDDLIVPFPTPIGPNWIERLFADARFNWALLPDVKATLSDRFNFLAEDDQPFPAHSNLRNDFREGYLTWAAGDGTFLSAGRINVRDGAAYGFNPTDFFKTRAVVDPTSQDPRVLREDRLGTGMVMGQHIFDGGAVTALFAPKLAEPSPVDLSNPPSFNPDFDRTNGDDRLLLRANYDFATDFSPELLIFHRDSRWTFGANLTRGLGNQATAYIEWAGGEQRSLIDEAIDYGIRTGTFPGDIPRLLPGSDAARFQNDLAVGATYTTETKVTFDLEYDFHQAGFSGSDERNWFAVGTAPNRPFFASDELWFIRSYATDQQEPLAQNSVFVRAEWVDAFVPKLTITGLTDVNLYDGSLLAQLAADYKWSDTWTAGVIAVATVGSRRTQFGSDPQAGSILLYLNRYF
jgi:hypothetical protein